MISTIFSTRVIKQPVGIPATIVQAQQAVSMELSDSKLPCHEGNGHGRISFSFYFASASQMACISIMLQQIRPLLPEGSHGTEPDQISSGSLDMVCCWLFDLQMWLTTKAWFQSRGKLESFQIELFVIYVYWSSQGSNGRTLALDRTGCVRSMMGGCVGIYNPGWDICFV